MAKTLEDCKNEVALAYNYNLDEDKRYKNWNDMEQLLTTNDLSNWVVSRMHEAAELYAEQKAKEAFEAAREKLNHPDWDYIYDNYEQYKTKI